MMKDDITLGQQHMVVYCILPHMNKRHLLRCCAALNHQLLVCIGPSMPAARKQQPLHIVPGSHH
jgi:hypothetical protein